MDGEKFDPLLASKLEAAKSRPVVAPGYTCSVVLTCVHASIIRRNHVLQHRADWDKVAAELGTHRTAAAVSAKYAKMTDKRPGCHWEMFTDDTTDPPVRCRVPVVNHPAPATSSPIH